MMIMAGALFHKGHTKILDVSRAANITFNIFRNHLGVDRFFFSTYMIACMEHLAFACS